MLRDSLQAFVHHDLPLVEKVIRDDDDVDDLYHQMRVTLTIAVAIVIAMLAPFMLAPLVFTPFTACALQALVGFMTLMAPMARLRAVIPEALDRFVEPPIGIGRAAIAVIPIIRLRAGRSSEK